MRTLYGLAEINLPPPKFYIMQPPKKYLKVGLNDSPIFKIGKFPNCAANFRFSWPNLSEELFRIFG